MENYLPLHLQEVIFGSKVSKISNQISKLLKTGLIKEVTPKAYSTNLDEPVEAIIQEVKFNFPTRHSHY